MKAIEILFCLLIILMFCGCDDSSLQKDRTNESSSEPYKNGPEINQINSTYINELRSGDSLRNVLLHQMMDTISIRATFGQILQLIKIAYLTVDASQRVVQSELEGKWFDFSSWTATESSSKNRIFVKVKSNDKIPSYVLIPNFFESGNDVEIFVQEGRNVRLFWVNIPKEESEPTTVSGSKSGIATFPSYPACFVGIKIDDQLLCIPGMDWDLTALERPFNRTSQILNIYQCNGALIPVKRLVCFDSHIIQLGRFDYNNNTEPHEVIGQIKFRNQHDGLLDSLTLHELLVQYNYKGYNNSRVKVLVENANLPLWFTNYGLYHTDPSKEVRQHKGNGKGADDS